jgi:hypothetical protein
VHLEGWAADIVPFMYRGRASSLPHIIERTRFAAPQVDRDEIVTAEREGKPSVSDTAPTLARARQPQECRVKHDRG